MPFSGKLHVEVLGCDRAVRSKRCQNQISLFAAFQSMSNEMRVQLSSRLRGKMPSSL